MEYTRKQLSQAGVYAIRHIASGNTYIGSTGRSFKARWKEHKVDMRRNVARNQYLQRAWNKYGEPAFEFIILEACDPNECIAREQHYIDMLKPEYNIAPSAGSNIGMKNPYTSARLRQMWQDPEVRQRYSEMSRGRALDSEARAIISEKASARWQDPARREHMSRLMRGRVTSEETRAKMRDAWTRRAPISAETRAKMAEANRGKKSSAETRNKRALSRTGGKVYTLVAPDGTLHTVVNISAFAEEHNIGRTNLNAVINGKRKHAKGWRLAE